MATSGTYNFSPSIGALTLHAFNLCGVRPSALIQDHFESARMAANLVLADFSNKGVNLWQVQLTTISFVAGTATYSVSPTIVNILDLYYTVSYGTGYTNRYILPVSRTEFASYPNPNQIGAVTTYWHDRTFSPTVNFYPTPDGSAASFTFYALIQMQDAAMTNGQTPDIPYLYLNAFTKALAVELATIWAPDRLAMLVPMAQSAYNAAAATNVETSQFFISPTISGYWRT